MKKFSNRSMNKKIGKLRKNNKFVINEMIDNIDTVEGKRELIECFSQLESENAEFAIWESLNNQSYEICRESALAYHRIAAKHGWDIQSVNPMNFRCYALLGDWPKCSEMFLQKRNILDPYYQGLEVCARILDNMNIETNETWQNKLSNTCETHREYFQSTFEKTSPYALLYPYSVIAWARTADLDSIKDLLSLVYNSGNRKASEMIIRFGADAVPNILYSSFQGTIDQQKYGNLESVCEDFIKRIGDEALQPLKELEIKHQGDAYIEKIQHWIEMIENGT